MNLTLFDHKILNCEHNICQVYVIARWVAIGMTNQIGSSHIDVVDDTNKREKKEIVFIANFISDADIIIVT